MTMEVCNPNNSNQCRYTRSRYESGSNANIYSQGSETGYLIDKDKDGNKVNGSVVQMYGIWKNNSDTYSNRITYNGNPWNGGTVYNVPSANSTSNEIMELANAPTLIFNNKSVRFTGWVITAPNNDKLKLYHNSDYSDFKWVQDDKNIPVDTDGNSYSQYFEANKTYYVPTEMLIHNGILYVDKVAKAAWDYNSTNSTNSTKYTVEFNGNDGHTLASFTKPTFFTETDIQLPSIKDTKGKTVKNWIVHATSDSGSDLVLLKDGKTWAYKKSDGDYYKLDKLGGTKISASDRLIVDNNSKFKLENSSLTFNGKPIKDDTLVFWAYEYTN